MKNKFLLSIIILLLLFVIWLLLGKNIDLSKITSSLTSIQQTTNTQDADISDEEISDADKSENNEKSKADENKTCLESGCPSGKYCTDDGKCEPNIPFKPIPDLSDSLKKGFKDLGNLVNRPNIDFGFNPKTVGVVATQGISGDSNQPKLISPDGVGAASHPHIFADKIIFTKFKGSTAIPYVYDLQTQKLESIQYSGGVHSPDIGSTGIVWYDYQRGGGEGADIHYLNPANNQQGYISPRAHYQEFPHIFGQGIIWSEQLDNGERAIYFYWLPSGEERLVKRLSGDKWFGYTTDIYGGSIVYSVLANGDHGTDSWVYKYDVSTKKTQEIIAVKGEIINYVSVWDRKIAYISGKKVFVYDMDSKLTRQVGSSEGEKRDLSLYGDKLVWADDRNGNLDIYLYDLSADKEKRLTSSEEQDSSPDIYGQIVVYRTNHDGGIRFIRL